MKSDYKPYLERILQSDTFSRSEINKQLLEYLFDATIKNKNLKEFTIANELFKKDDSSGIRVYIHNLRKKLDEYYKKEGEADEIILSIPKGAYKIQFRRAKPKARKLKKKWYWLVLIMIKILVLYSIYMKYHEATPLQKSCIWNSFLYTDENVLITLGDHFFMQAFIITKKGGIIRDYDINSSPDLEQYFKKNPEMKDSISELPYRYLTWQAPACLFKIMPLFRDLSNTSIKMSSEVNYQDIKNRHIIFFGSYKSLGVIKEFISDTLIEFEGEKRILNDASDRRNREIAEVIRLKTDYNKNIFLFVCQNDAGNIATLQYFTNIDSVKAFEERAGLNVENNIFKAEFEVESMGRTDMGIKVLNIEKL